MSAINWEKLKEDAAETLSKIDLDNLTKNSFILAGAAMGFLAYPQQSPEHSIPHLEAAINPSVTGARRDYVPNSQIDEILQDLLQAFVDYSAEKSIYQSTPSDNSKVNMLGKLDVMLDMQRQIFSVLWRSSDISEEQEKLKEFFAKIKKSGSSSKSDLLSNLEDELSDSEKYYKLWRETGISDYKQMSHDELHHYELLVKIARMSNSSVDIGDTMIWHDSMLAKLR